MNLSERHREIMNILGRIRKISVQELTERLGVSEVTIRKDLTFLGETGKLLRTHGGAMLAEDKNLIYTLNLRRKQQIKEKKAMAARARQLIHEGDTIFLDAGTSCFFLAREIHTMNIRVITNSLAVMMELSTAPGINLHSVGGSFRRDAGSFIGPIADETIKKFQIETCFLGATGFSGEGIFSSQNIIESGFKSSVISVSGRKIMLCDSGKYNKKAFSIFARVPDIDVLITDNQFTGANIFRELGIETIFA